MKASLRPLFSSPELQKAIAETRPVLEGVDAARNRVSNDIKALEGYLQELALRASFRYPLGKCFVTDAGHGQYVGAAIEYNGTASGNIEEEALLWGEDRTGKFRLLYERSRWEGYVDVDVPGGPLLWEEETLEREARPLIESKFDVRKRMYQHLPHFITALAEHFSIEPRGNQQISRDEIAF